MHGRASLWLQGIEGSGYVRLPLLPFDLLCGDFVSFGVVSSWRGRQMKKYDKLKLYFRLS